MFYDYLQCKYRFQKIRIQKSKIWWIRISVLRYWLKIMKKKWNIPLQHAVLYHIQYVPNVIIHIIKLQLGIMYKIKYQFLNTNEIYL